MSPEGFAHAIEKYLESLQTQANAAKAFYFGKFGEGMEGLLALPEHVRLKIDQLIWDAAGGEPIDPTDPATRPLLIGAILHSLEERMGFHEKMA